MTPHFEESTVTITKREFLERAADATSKVVDKLNGKEKDAKFAALIIMIGAVLASEQAKLLFGETAKTKETDEWKTEAD